MINIKRIYAILILCVFLSGIVSAQTGGTFAITQGIVSNGGGVSSGGNFGLTGTTNQPFAGTNSTNGQFGVSGGFWQAFFAPTAAMVSVSGRVLTTENQPIGQALVTLIGGYGITRTSRTNTFGYFRFDNVEVGQTYIISVHHKRFQFGNETQVVFVGDEITDFNFNALPE